METTELIKKVRRIEIKTRGLSNQIFSGEYHSAFKGRGMAFSEVREYVPGDDIRRIDWNVTSRFNHPYVKVFEEERELTVMLLVDISSSGNFGTQKQFKRELITELCAVLSFSAIQNNDKIGIIFFSDIIEKFIPPKKGKAHILRIISELIQLKPKHRATDVAQALKFMTNAIKKRSIAFIISDFIAPPFESTLKIASKKHDTVAVQVYDERELSLPDMGLIRFIDEENGTERWVDTSSAQQRQAYQLQAAIRNRELGEVFRRSGVDLISLKTGQDYIKPLMTLFKKRENH